MDWLLKIVDGPMKGAEIALVNGMRVSFGSADTCDVVVADAALAPLAFSLDVAAEAVSLVRDDDDIVTLPPFEKHTFGATAFAVGPAQGAWEPLHDPAAAAASAAEAEPAAEPAPEAPAESAPADEAPAEAAAAEASAAPRRKGRGCLVCALVLIVLAAALVALAWFFRAPLGARFPAFKACADRVAGTVGACCGKAPAQTPASAAKGPSLAEIASAHHLTLERTEAGCVLRGNLKRRTERLALRALARAADARAKIELTDDETLAASAEATLLAVCEGAVKVARAENRRLTLAGQAVSRAELEEVLRALAADVPGLDGVDAAQVRIDPVRRAARGAAPATAGAVLSVGASAPAAKPVKAPASKPVARTLPVPSLPVAGILTVPYACVVLHDGRRCVEGAYFGKARLVKIAADALTLEEEGTSFVWKP